MRTALWCLAILLLCAQAAQANAAKPAPIGCPPELASSVIQINAGPGWRPFVAAPLPLHSAGMSAGPPQSLSQLRGMDLQRKGESPKTLYELGGVGYEEGKWLDCSYGRAGEVSISRRLDDALSSCVITHSARSRSQRERIEISCR